VLLAGLPFFGFNGTFAHLPPLMTAFQTTQLLKPQSSSGMRFNFGCRNLGFSVWHFGMASPFILVAPQFEFNRGIVIIAMINNFHNIHNPLDEYRNMFHFVNRSQCDQLP
jgi:hypothetical protein